MNKKVNLVSQYKWVNLYSVFLQGIFRTNVRRIKKNGNTLQELEKQIYSFLLFP